MIQAKLTNGDLLFGLTDLNFELLKKGRPIIINLKKLGLEDRNIMIVHGKTEDEIHLAMLDFIDLEKTKIHFPEPKDKPDHDEST